jgi:hypothetical protein
MPHELGGAHDLRAAGRRHMRVGYCRKHCMAEARRMIDCRTRDWRRCGAIGGGRPSP